MEMGMIVLSIPTSSTILLYSCLYKRGMYMKMVSLQCANPTCGVEFSRSLGEHRRSIKLGRPEFCGRKCSAVLSNKSEKRDRLSGISNLISDNKRDEYSPFRWYMGRIRQRREKKGDTNLTVEFLKDLWEAQEGKCALCNMDLVLPVSTSGKWETGSRLKKASLDRIDSSKGYVRGNVRFISLMANTALGTSTDEELIEFCKAVGNNMGK
jgi:hypothetical protein